MIGETITIHTDPDVNFDEDPTETASSEGSDDDLEETAGIDRRVLFARLLQLEQDKLLLESPPAYLVVNAFRLLNWEPDDTPFSYKGLELINQGKNSPYRSITQDKPNKEGATKTITAVELIGPLTKDSSGDKEPVRPRQLLEILAQEIAKCESRPWEAAILSQQLGQFEREIENIFSSVSEIQKKEIPLIPGVSIIFSPSEESQNTYKVSFEVDKAAIDAGQLRHLEFIADWLKGPVLIQGITKKLIQLSRGEDLPISLPITEVFPYFPDFRDFDYLRRERKHFGLRDPQFIELPNGIFLQAIPVRGREATHTTYQIVPDWDKVRSVRQMRRQNTLEMCVVEMVAVAPNDAELMDAFSVDQKSQKVAAIRTRLLTQEDETYSIPEVNDTLQKYIYRLMPKKIQTYFAASKSEPYTESEVMTIRVMRKEFRVIFFQIQYKYDKNGAVENETVVGIKKVAEVDQSLIDTNEAPIVQNYDTPPPKPSSSVV